MSTAMSVDILAQDSGTQRVRGKSKYLSVTPPMARGGSGHQRGPESAERIRERWERLLRVSVEWHLRRFLGLPPNRPPQWRPPLTDAELQHWAYFSHGLEPWQWEEPEDGAPPQ